MIELEYSSILKHKIKVYVDGNHVEDVKVILDEIGADYYLNIDDNNVLVYYRPIKTNVNNFRIALDGFDYETAKRVKVIELKACRKQKLNKLKYTITAIAIMIIATALIIFATYNENITKDTRSFICLDYIIILMITSIWHYIKVR